MGKKRSTHAVQKGVVNGFLFYDPRIQSLITLITITNTI